MIHRFLTLKLFDILFFKQVIHSKIDSFLVNHFINFNTHQVYLTTTIRKGNRDVYSCTLSPFPIPWQLLVYFLSQLFAFQECHINEIIRYVIFETNFFERIAFWNSSTFLHLSIVHSFLLLSSKSII